MKNRRGESSVQRLMQLLRHSRLLTAEELDDIASNWKPEAELADDVEAFGRWLVDAHYVTEYQLAMLLNGRLDRFFLGEYRLLDRIGKGRQAKVFKAVGRLGQMVAIKVLPPSRARNPHLLKRYQREVRLSQQLNHPNLVRALGAGQDRNLHYLIMEYLEGETLDQVLTRTGKLSLVEARAIALQVLAALQHLHELGLVHRNLEPSNLLLLRSATGQDLAARQVKLLDLSLARPVGQPTSNEDELRQSLSELQLLAVPSYLAPEVARDPQGSDIRGDLYSLGCILYHCLAGRPPFSGVNRIEQLIRQATELPTPLTDLPPEFATILDRLLAPRPDDRFATPQEAIAALQAFLPATEKNSLGETVQEVELMVLPVQTVAVLPDVQEPPSEVAEVAPAPPSAVDSEIWRFEEASQRHQSSDSVLDDKVFDRRDWLMLLLGATSLLFVQVLSWGLARLGTLIRRKPGRDP